MTKEERAVIVRVIDMLLAAEPPNGWSPGSVAQVAIDALCEVIGLGCNAEQRLNL